MMLRVRCLPMTFFRFYVFVCPFPPLPLPRLDAADVAPTFCALLGLPVPRQTVGSFIPELMLFFNQTRLTAHWRVGGGATGVLANIEGW